MRPELVIIVLTMPKKGIKERLLKRHYKDEDKGFVDILMVRTRLLKK